MSLGTGIFLSTIFVSIILLYRSSSNKLHWKQLIIKSTKWIFILSVGAGFTAVIVGLCTLIYEEYEDWPTKQTSYWGIALNSSKEEVLYIKGTPFAVHDPITNKTIEVSKNAGNFYDYKDWVYKPYPALYPDAAYFISFNKANKVEFISCQDNCNYVLGISTYSSEKDVIEKLGKPDSVYVNLGKKRLEYKNLNLRFLLERENVEVIGIGKTPPY